MLKPCNDALAAIAVILAIARTRTATITFSATPRLRSRGAAAILFSVVGGHTGANAATVLDLPSRPGITQQVSLEAVDAPRAAVVLFAGSEGGVRFADDGAPATMRGNFLVRSRALFHPFQIATAVLGLPSDHARAPYLTDEFRESSEHATDVAAVIIELRRRWQVPVWLVGTSRGTLSAAASALHLGGPSSAGRGPDGVVLTSSMTAIADLAIDQFAQPVLVVQHQNDTCRVTDTRDLPRIKSKLKAPRVEVMLVSGGISRGPLCESNAHHGFNGIEDQVVADIAHWILDKSSVGGSLSLESPLGWKGKRTWPLNATRASFFH